MRILHVADRLSDRGGAYTWLLGIVEALRGEHQVQLVVGQDDGVAHPCPVFVRAGLTARTAARFELDDLAGAADVIHLHNLVNPALLEWAAERSNALLTVQDHRLVCPGRGKWTSEGEVCREVMARTRCSDCLSGGAYFEEVYALTERRLAAARRLPLTVLSRYMREELVTAGVAPNRVHVVPPFVTGLDAVVPATGPPCVLFVGRLVESKGVWEAVEAWRGSGLDLPLVFVGTGPLRERLEAAGAEQRIEVTGWLGRKELAGAYARARALVFPSRWQEPFGMVGLEALSLGVPVAAWESGGVGEWHPGPGLVRWGDVPALARALREVAGRTLRLRPHFDRDEATGRLLALYGRLARRAC
jgi:glycosyltransferase involved in cell wall biosynthesis